MDRNNPNDRQVYLVHTGDPAKQWDPKDREIMYGRKPKGEPEDAIIHYIWDGQDGKIYPGDKIMTQAGLATRIIAQKTLRPEIMVKNKVTGFKERFTMELPPPLRIVELQSTRQENQVPIGAKLSEDETSHIHAEPVKIPELPPEFEMAEPEQPAAKTDKLNKPSKPVEPEGITKSQLAAMGKKNLKKMCDEIGIDLGDDAPDRDAMIEAILKSQEA